MTKKLTAALLKSTIKSSRTLVKNQSKPTPKPKPATQVKKAAIVKSPVNKKGLLNPGTTASVKGSTSKKLPKPKTSANAVKKISTPKSKPSKKTAVKIIAKEKNHPMQARPVKNNQKKPDKLLATTTETKDLILSSLYTDYYLKAILNSRDNIPGMFELQNVKKFLLALIEKDLRVKQNIAVDSSTLITYLKPIFDEYQLEFPDDFYAKFRNIVESIAEGDIPVLPLQEQTEFTKAIITLSLTGEPCKE